MSQYFYKENWSSIACIGVLKQEIPVLRLFSEVGSRIYKRRDKPLLVPHVPRYFANKSSARYKIAFEEYTKRHAKRGGTATPWSNLEVSSVGRRSFVSRQHLRESLLPATAPLRLTLSPFLSLLLLPRLTTPALNPRGFAHMSTIYFLPAHKSFSG